MKKNIFLIILSLVAFASCKQEVKEAIPFTFNKPGGSPTAPAIGSSITLISPASSPSFNDSPVFEVNGVASGDTVKIFTNSLCTTLIGSAVSSGTSVTISSIPLPVGTFAIYTNTKNVFATSACSGALTTYQYLGVEPTTATSMTLVSPASSPGSVATPTIMLSGVVAGETSRLYVDSGCTLLYGSALASSSTVNIVSDQLAPGVNQFYTNSSNVAGTGQCSAALLSYDYTGVIPTSASSVVLSSPSTSPNYVSTPTFLVSGINNGDTVNLYTDASCLTLVGTATSTGSTTYVTTAALSVASHTFYTNSSNIVGSSACSGAVASYNYLGPAPSVEISWAANHEKAVNKIGGGYRVYYSTTSGIDVSTATYVDVPYVSGPTAPVSKIFTNLLIGTTYFKVQAYSSLNAPGTTTGSKSAASTEFSISLP